MTGAASGIGRALAEALAQDGAQVVLADRQVDLAEEVAEGIREAGGAARVAELDVRDAGRFQAVVDELFEREGRLDWLFNNAGVGVSAEIKDYEPADWDDVFDVNLRGVAHGILAAYPRMVEQGFGHIVNTASMAGLFPTAFTGSYTATKFAVVGLSRSLRLEAAPHGVRVSVLCPGVIRTPILEGGRYGRLKYRYDAEKLQRSWEEFRPLPAPELARRALRQMDRNRAIIVEPRWWKAIWYVDRLSPGLGERLGRLMYRRMRARFDEIRIG